MKKVTWVTITVLSSLLFLLTGGIGSVAQDWPRYGHDGALTGRCAGRGEIEAPQVAWTYALAGRDLFVEMLPSTGEHRLSLSAGTQVEFGARQTSNASPRRLDLDGSGSHRPVTETFHERWAKILPDIAGFQRVAWNHTWTDQKVCRLQLFAYDKGIDQPRRIWETNPPEATIFNPLNIVFDIDNDGVQEICVAAHYRVMIFEGTTGRKETELRYHSSRPYGWFGLADVDADDQVELVTIGDFQSHIDVLIFDPTRPEAERLSVKWRRDIEQDIDKREKWPQVGPHPVVDVTGDGRPEIVVNMFNDTGDGQWHGVVFDGATGQATCDLAGRFVQGMRDVDADGAAELFTTSTNGVLVNQAGDIQLVALRDPAPNVRWSRAASSWCLADIPRLGPLWSTTASQGMKHVLLQGGEHPVFFVKTWDPDGLSHVELSALQCGTGGKVQSLWEIEDLPEGCDVVPVDPPTDNNQAAALVHIELPANVMTDLVGRGVQPRVVASRPLGIGVSMPVVTRLGRGKQMSVVTEGPGQHVFAITPPTDPANSPQLKWQRRGRGMRDGSRAVGLLATDLDGDAVNEIVVADQAREGHAVLIVYRGDGTLMWEKTFDQTPGAIPVWNTGALTFWWPGHFRDPNVTDLFVNTRRGLMHSDIGHLIDGRDATTVWKRDKAIVPGQFHWGWAGTPLASVNVGQDACDELVSLHPVCFWIADGQTGNISAGIDLASRKMLPAWAAYGEPLVHDFDGDRRPEVLLDSPYILALLDLTGKPLWHGLGRMDYPVKPGEGNEGETTPCKHALMDLDGDGSFEIASAGYGDGVRAIDPRTGQVLWSLAAPEPTGPRATAANIDGKDGDELLFPAGTALVAVTGDRDSGRILWTWQGPATLSLPAVADIDGDGLLEILVQDANGTIHCLDAQP